MHECGSHIWVWSILYSLFVCVVLSSRVCGLYLPVLGLYLLYILDFPFAQFKSIEYCVISVSAITSLNIVLCTTV